MMPKVGDVFMLDLGFQGKTRPVVIVSREDHNAPRALSVFVPLTKESRGGKYEVTMPRVPWLKLQSYANALGMGAAEWHELTDRRGRFDAATITKIKDAIRWTLDL
jgi:mRNA-degrading endonuclease toxin of MazEF toxin-antitoxin module